MAFNIHEALRSACEYWTPERIASSVPLDDLFTVCGDTSRLVQSHPTADKRPKPRVSNAPTSDPVSREDGDERAEALSDTDALSSDDDSLNEVKDSTPADGDKRAEALGDTDALTSDLDSLNKVATVEDNTPADGHKRAEALGDTDALTSNLDSLNKLAIVEDNTPADGNERAEALGDTDALTSDLDSHNKVDQITPAASNSAVLHSSQSQRPATRSQRREVKDEELKSTPYQSIGKVYARRKGGEVDVYVSAFYIGQPTAVNGEEYHRLLTVAHAFNYSTFKKANELIFVPSIYAKTNELYIVLPGIKKCHPSYRCYRMTKKSCWLTVKFDLCVLYVHPKSVVDMNIDRFTPLLLVANGDFTVKTKFKAIGYATQSKLSEVEGNYIRSHTLKQYEALTIQIDNDARLGMSGGPWIIQGEENKLVYGIQSCITPQEEIKDSKGKEKDKKEELNAASFFRRDLFDGECNATSPYFRIDLFDGLELVYITEEELHRK